MQLPDETIDYQFQGLIALTASDAFTPLLELQSKNFLPQSRLKGLIPQVTQARGQVSAERELARPPAELMPLDSSFIELPQKCLEQHRQKGAASELGRVLDLAGRLREQT